MVTENHFNKYLVYSIGEIILVILGILIALQINNWNEEQKQKKEEIIILKEIAQNLELDLEDIENSIIHFNNALISSEHLIQAINKNANYNDSLAFYLHFAGFVPYLIPNLSGYKLLESKGLEIISNDSLRQTITSIYDIGYPWLLKREETNRNYVAQSLHLRRSKYLGTFSLFKDSRPNSLRENPMHNSQITSGSIRKLINFEELKKDTELISAIKDAGVRAKLESHWTQYIELGVVNLMDQIEREIQNNLNK